MVLNQQNMEPVYEKAARKAELMSLCLSLRRERTRLEAETGRLETNAMQEQLDVEQLEGLSIKGMLLWLMGKREKTLAMERHEAMEAQQALEESQSMLSDVTARLEEVQAELAALENWDEQLVELVSMQLPAFRAVCSQPEALSDLEGRLAELEQRRNALEKTDAAGLAARKELALALDGLRTAKEQAQVMGGMSSVADTDSLCRIQQKIVNLRDELSLFKEAMLDLELPQELRFDLHDFLMMEPDFLVKHRTNTIVTGAIPGITARLQQADHQIAAILAYAAEEREETETRLLEAWVAVGSMMLKQKN